MLFAYTEASEQALQGLRDLSMLKWYIVPLFGLLIYVYAKEIVKSRESGNWDAILAALVLFGCDFFNETWNGWVFHLSERSAVWTTPGETALRVFVGWNIEIILTFALFGLVYYHTILPDRESKVLGIPNRWFFSILFAAFAVFIEVVLNIGDKLIWEYSFWNLSFAGIWLIFLVGYFYWFVAINIMLNMKTMRNKLIFVGAIYAVPIILNVVGLGILGWRY